MVTVRFTSTLRELTGEDHIEIEASSVRRLIRLLDERWPGIGERLSDGMAIAINGEIIPDAEFEELPDGADVHFIPAIAGG